MHIRTTPAFRPDHLRVAASAKGLTQQDVAVRLGMSMRAVQKWFLGESVPGGGSLIALARLLDQEPGWFFEEEDEAA